MKRLNGRSDGNDGVPRQHRYRPFDNQLRRIELVDIDIHFLQAKDDALSTVNLRESFSLREI